MNFEYRLTKKEYNKMLRFHMHVVKMINYISLLLTIILSIIEFLDFRKGIMNPHVIFFLVVFFIVMINTLILRIYDRVFKNHMINSNNFLYAYHVEISGKDVRLTLKDGEYKEKYSFPLSKIVLEKSAYVLYKDDTHFFFVPRNVIETIKIKELKQQYGL